MSGLNDDQIAIALKRLLPACLEHIRRGLQAEISNNTRSQIRKQEIYLKMKKTASIIIAGQGDEVARGDVRAPGAAEAGPQVGHGRFRV